MFALPEVEVLRRDLEREVVGRRIRDVEVRPGSNAMKVIKRHGRRKEFRDLLVGARVDRVGRIGRRVVLGLDNGRSLVVDLGESALVLKTSTSDGLAPHTHIVVGFTIGGQLRVVDPRLTGEVFVVGSGDLDGAHGLRPSALDPLETPLAWQHFSSLLQNRAETMKELLMDEGFICGLGDVYSDEVLFVAGIRHDRPSDRLSSQDVRRLYRGLMETLQDAVRARGTSHGANAFLDLEGKPGHFQLDLKVYEREGEPCRRCRHEIVRAASNGRFTYFCPQCQT
ncbi:MAG TPA: DNA-formamidopyrimidine glycosylase family protein [Actinomycetota bacterium]|nr:DNA-formamidopyrimidine glycosylase family protein [Actinomycetota bacterium]